MDETPEEQESAPSSIGEQLRAAREAQGLSLEDIANQTRIPRRHLEAIEASDWDKLPAPTYTIGFAKSYASIVGIDRTEIGEELRAEMGGLRPANSVTEVYEPADPARTMPRWLVVSAVVAIILAAIGFSWWKGRELEPDAPLAEEQQATPEASAAAPGAQPVRVPPPVAGPVVLTAREPVWIRVSERGGQNLYEGVLAAGATYQVPSTAQAPVLRTGKPEALIVTVGTGQAPPIGPAATTVSDVSLLGPDLMRGTAPAAGDATAPPQRQPATGAR